MSMFGANYWKSLYFRAIGRREQNPNAMQGSFVGASSFEATLVAVGAPVAAQDFDGGYRKDEVTAEAIEIMARADEARHKRKQADTNSLRDIIRRVFSESDAPKPAAKTVRVPAVVADPVVDKTAETEAALLALRQRDDDDEIIIMLLLAA
jgi:hypothetical protein